MIFVASSIVPPLDKYLNSNKYRGCKIGTSWYSEDMEGSFGNTEKVEGPHGADNVQTRRRGLVAGLRSGDYAQTRGVLHQVTGAGDRQIGFCCLGVACEVAIAQGLELLRSTYADCMHYDGRGKTLPPAATRWFHFDDENPYLRIPDEVADEVTNKRFQEERVRPRTLWSASDLNDLYKFTLAQIADCFEYTYLPQDWEQTRAARRS